MELSKTYAPQDIERRWYEQWIENKLFESHPDKREPYTIVMPPPNVTGVLHMGHALNNTIQDILIRRARMQNKNACWVPGTDHASISTEAKVVGMLREKGIEKNSLTREEFLKYAWEWRDKYGGIILKQLRLLGCSCDWSRTAFTMDEDYYKAVIDTFIDLYRKGHIYRGMRIINWDPKAKTALSDEEVIYKEVKSKLYFVKYKLDGIDGYITIATTRPETIFGDTAVCVHPEDIRYTNLIGKYAIIPLVNRKVPIIADDYIDREFGTGALKVTPAHDANDYALGIKHKLDIVDVLNDDGTMSKAAQFFVGEDRFIVRKKIAKQLEEMGLLVKTEELTNNNGFSERTDVVIEPRLSIQWWCKMTDMAKPALDAVLNEDIKFYPGKYVNLYRHWMENIKDWCISRQLWWGHRIPAYYLPDGKFVVAESLEKAFELAKELPGQTLLKIEDLTQDNDVLDTWFSSWLWPMEVFGWNKNADNKDLNYYYPTNTLVTAPEIIFFWVARMIMAGYEYKDKKPFDSVYYTGIVRDKLGRKMSKSLGNSPDLLEMIEQKGADGVRFGTLICSPAGNDLMFDEKSVEQGRNFCNKLWNALRLLKGWTIDDTIKADTLACDWFEARMNEATAELDKEFNNFTISEALKKLYSLIWDDFCAWYLEMIKPEFGQPISKVVYDKTVDFFEQLMKLLHPFMPFITEEIYQSLKERNGKDFITVAQYPPAKSFDKKLVDDFDKAKDLVIKVREYRNKNNMKPKEGLKLFASADLNSLQKFHSIISKQANLISFDKTATEPANTYSFLVGAEKFFIQSDTKLDATQERPRLEKELEAAHNLQRATQAKLTNEKFIANAKPELIHREKQKLADAEMRIRSIEASLKQLDVEN